MVSRSNELLKMMLRLEMIRYLRCKPYNKLQDLHKTKILLKLKLEEHFLESDQ
jgi:hypothetical protein